MSAGRSLRWYRVVDEIAAIQYPPAAANAMTGRHSDYFDCGRDPPPCRHRAENSPAEGGYVNETCRAAGPSRHGRFYVFASFFSLFVLFLSPDAVIYILSFSGPTGGRTFPMTGFSLTGWFHRWLAADASATRRLLSRSSSRVGVAILTVVLWCPQGLGFRRRFPGFGSRFLPVRSRVLIKCQVFSSASASPWAFQCSVSTIDWYPSALAPTHLDAALGSLSNVRRAWAVHNEPMRGPRPISAARPGHRLREVGHSPICCPHHRRSRSSGFTLSYDAISPEPC